MLWQVPGHPRRERCQLGLCPLPAWASAQARAPAQEKYNQRLPGPGRHVRGQELCAGAGARAEPLRSVRAPCAAGAPAARALRRLTTMARTATTSARVGRRRGLRVLRAWPARHLSSLPTPAGFGHFALRVPDVYDTVKSIKEAGAAGCEPCARLRLPDQDPSRLLLQAARCPGTPAQSRAAPRSSPLWRTPLVPALCARNPATAVPKQACARMCLEGARGRAHALQGCMLTCLAGRPRPHAAGLQAWQAALQMHAPCSTGRRPCRRQLCRLRLMAGVPAAGYKWEIIASKTGSTINEPIAQARHPCCTCAQTWQPHVSRLGLPAPRWDQRPAHLGRLQPAAGSQARQPGRLSCAFALLWSSWAGACSSPSWLAGPVGLPAARTWAGSLHSPIGCRVCMLRR